MAASVSSNKCSTCHAATPKYRCPRCSARSCSLSCVQTHKARNLCSGIRDPTKFLSRRQLTDPAAFDSDFNLLSGIERGIEKAERVFTETLDEGVRIWSAPKGVMRSRENHTNVEGRRKCVVWTIEWKFLGRRVLATVSESISLLDGHNIAVLDAYRAELVKDQKQALREYIIRNGIAIPIGYQGRKDLASELGLAPEKKSSTSVDDNNTAEEEMNRESKNAEGSQLAQTVDASKAADSLDDQGKVEKTPPAAQEESVHSASESGQKTISEAETIVQPATNRKFFIHRPELSTAQKQIITKCDGRTSLRDVLKGKTVREFPTFLVEISGKDEIDRNHWHLFDEAETWITEDNQSGRGVSIHASFPST